MEKGSHIDAHCHLADPRLAPTLEAVIQKARAHGITGFVQGGVGPEDWRRQQVLAEKHPGIHPVFGLHPWWVAEHSEAELARGLGELESVADRAVALGEMGLDYLPRWPEASHALQRRAFEAQLDLAIHVRKPVILHVVKAHGPALESLEGRQAKGQVFSGLVHSYSGNAETARRYLRLGFLISVSGVVTRKGYESLKKTVVKLPPESLVIETDSPDQPLAGSLPGQPNEPAMLLEVAKAVGALRGETAQAVLERSTQNVRRLLQL